MMVAMDFERGYVLRLALLVALVLAGWGGTAFAQSDDVRRIGLFVSVQGSYEDNVLRQPKNFPLTPGFARKDFRLSPALNIDIVQPIGGQKLTLAGGIGYDFYNKNKRLERERVNLVGNLDLKVGPNCTPKLGVSYLRQQSDLADFFALTNVRLRNREQRLVYSASVKCSGVVGLRPGLSIERTNAKNSAFLRRIGNFNQTSYGVSLGYVTPTLGEVSLFGNYRRGNYPNRGRFAIGSGSVGDNVGVYSGGVRLQRDIGTRLKGNVSLGYTKADPSIPGTRGFSGASGSADLTAQLLDRLQAVIGYSRTVEQSNRLDVSFSVNSSYSINANYILNPRFSLTAGASRINRRLSDSLLLAPNLLGRNDRTSQVSAGARYRPGIAPISFSLNATKAFRKSETGIFDYDATTVSLTTNYNF